MLEFGEIDKVVLTGAILAGIDYIGINLLLKDYFSKLIKGIQKKDMKIRYSGAIFTYIIMTLGLYYFIIKEERSIVDAFLLGVLIYGVFEGTNYALFDNWELKALVMDTTWGGILFALTTYAFYKIKKNVL